MSLYTKIVNYLTKDSLLSGNPLKIVRGSELDAEFEAISDAIDNVSTCQSSASDPGSTAGARSFWADEGNGLQKQRNAANSEWDTLYTLGERLAERSFASNASNLTSGTLPSGRLSANDVFASGTRMAFQQTAAPTGWTKDTTSAINDSILRLVTGTVGSGGSTTFSTFNGQTSTGAYTLTIADIPPHHHETYVSIGAQQGHGSSVPLVAESVVGGQTLDTGGGGAHSHGLTHSIKYYDFIIASKN